MIMPFEERLKAQAKWKDLIIRGFEEVEKELGSEPVPYWSKEERAWLQRLRQLSEAYNAASDVANEAEKALKACRDEVNRRPRNEGGSGAYRGPGPCEKEQKAYKVAGRDAEAAWKAYLNAQDEFFEKFPHRKPE